jgi:hypothetical protein
VFAVLDSFAGFDKANAFVKRPRRLGSPPTSRVEEPKGEWLDAAFLSQLPSASTIGLKNAAREDCAWLPPWNRRLFSTTRADVSVWQRAAVLSIPICIMTRFHQVGRLQSVLERFSNVPVALDHLGLPRLSDGPPYERLQPLFDLARYPNVYLKFSTETMYAAQRSKSNSNGRANFRRVSGELRKTGLAGGADWI